MSEESLKNNDTLNNNRLHAIERLQSFLPEEKELIELNNEIVSIGGEPDRSVLRNWQLEFFQNLEQNLEEGKTEGYVEVPTGAGKTRAFLRLIKATDLKTLIVVPTKLLVDQTHDEHEKQIKEKTVGKRYSGRKDTDQDVLITTYESLVRDINSGKLDPKEFGLLILDEAHRALSDKRTNTINKFTNSIKLGFTATPVFNKEKHLGKLLENKIYEKTISEAIQEEIISGFKVYAVKTDIDLSNVSLTSTGEYNNEQLEKAINKESRNKACVEVYKNLFKDKKVIAYCNGIEHAKNVAEEFRKQGISAEAGYGRMSDQQKKDLLKRYHDSEIKILTGDQLYIEGFDEPSIEVAFMLDPTRSLVNAEQRAGRALRIDPKNQNKIAGIVEFLDKNTSENMPISFVDIAGENVIIPSNKDSKSERRKERLEKATDMQLEGIEGTFSITTNVKEVLELMKLDLDTSFIIPDGWTDAVKLSKALNVSYQEIDKASNNLLERINFGDKSLMVTSFINNKKKRINFYSAEFVENIKRQVLINKENKFVRIADNKRFEYERNARKGKFYVEQQKSRFARIQREEVAFQKWMDEHPDANDDDDFEI